MNVGAGSLKYVGEHLDSVGCSEGGFIPKHMDRHIPIHCRTAKSGSGHGSLTRSRFSSLDIHRVDALGPRVSRCDSPYGNS